jgi:lipopolysaccharide/colanic/teichoic acid biosynthesis glycosyltransferase
LGRVFSARGARRSHRSDRIAKRVLDVLGASGLLVFLLPLLVLVAAALKLSSRGPLFFRSSRVGFEGQELAMLKFRKMRVGASGAALTTRDDVRFTRLGKLLARLKIDEIPQLWNVLKGEMSLVGPRPEDRSFVATRPDAYSTILTVKPGITGLCQLAFANESEILDREAAVDDYVRRLLPQKIALDLLYVERQSLLLDLRILLWTTVVVLLRRHVSVHRTTGELTLRRRPEAQTAAVTTGAG